MRAPSRTEPLARDSILLSVALGVLISVAISWSLMQDVWTTGAFFDTDDATRLVQVRDWMAGQAWYDLHMHRLGLPGAAPMHWTRIVDAPVALLIKSASLVLDPVMAERAARIAFPLLVMIAVLFVTALIAIELMSDAGVLTSCLLAALAGLSMLQFQPGRIDHHAPQILLLLTSGLFLLRSIDRRHAWRDGALSAGCLAVSLAISLENLPAACVVAGCFACLWAAQGNERKAGLNGFGWGLLAATPLVYALTVAPSRWLTTACDAQSFLHVVLAVLGGATCIAVTRLDHRTATRRARFLCLGAAAIAIVAVMRLGFPHCGLDPYGDVDPLVRSEWLNKVKEAFSLGDAWSRGLTQFVFVNFIPACTGVAGLVFAVFRTRGDAQTRWMVWLALALMTFAVAMFRIGYVQTLQMATCFGAAYIISLLPAQWRALRIPGAFALSVVALAFLLPADGSAKPNGKPAAHCTRPQDASGLALLPAGRLLAPIDEGAYLLAFTRHQIVAAPYHRNNAGNRLEAEAFTRPAEDALQLFRSREVDYVAICGDERRKSPLVAALSSGMPGVQRLDVEGAYQVWRVLP